MDRGKSRPASAPSNRRSLNRPMSAKQRRAAAAASTRTPMSMYAQGSFEAPLQHFRTQAPIWEGDEGAERIRISEEPRRVKKTTRRPVSAADARTTRSGRSPRHMSDRSKSVGLPKKQTPGRSSRGKLRSQYDELNVLERVFDDIMTHEDQKNDESSACYYNKMNDELMTESEFLEFVEAHPDQLDQCCDVEVAMTDMSERWAGVSQYLDEQHYKLTTALMASAAADQESEHQIQSAQEVVRQNFRDLRHELDQREDTMLAEVEAAYHSKVQQQLNNTQGGEEHLERVERCRELGSRLCSNLRPMLLPFCNKLLFSKAKRLLEKQISADVGRSHLKIVPDSLNEHPAMLEAVASVYKVKVVPR
eukprot:TRINITY_DN11197_c0_g1_i7.p1 TRINITY_DN11197_c0_g1~~TRINITY_DN11197_c0_g1_i7.p1  ORF type:complete len:363 (+),score=71.81 TRINITY_DN11197_c0_g1_i7:176-1264(+)